MKVKEKKYKDIRLQPDYEDATLLLDENAAIVEMRKQYMAKQRVIKVKGAFLPYIREGSQIAVFDKGNNRFKIRIPVALRKDDRSFITAPTEQEAFDKMYYYLFGDDQYTVRSLFKKVLEQKENDPDTSSLTVTRYRQIWKKYYENYRRKIKK